MKKKLTYIKDNRTIRWRWTCFDHVRHEHRWYWIAWLCGRWQWVRDFVLQQRRYKPSREQLKEGREHLTVTNKFQSDKYEWCPSGFVPLKITDPMARDVLFDYADRRRTIDSEFSRDLEDALWYSESNALVMEGPFGEYDG